MQNEISTIVSNCKVVLGKFRFGSVKRHLITSQPAIVAARKLIMYCKIANDKTK